MHLELLVEQALDGPIPPLFLLALGTWYLRCIVMWIKQQLLLAGLVMLARLAHRGTGRVPDPWQLAP